jgi:hypothetical protein
MRGIAILYISFEMVVRWKFLEEAGKLEFCANCHPELIDQVKAAIPPLPEGYEILSCFGDLARRALAFYISGPGIPEVTIGEELPVFSPKQFCKYDPETGVHKISIVGLKLFHKGVALLDFSWEAEGS